MKFLQKITSWLFKHLDTIIIVIIAFGIGYRQRKTVVYTKPKIIKERAYNLVKPPSIITKVITKKVKVPHYIVDTLSDTIHDTILKYIDLHTGIKAADIKRKQTDLLYFIYDTIFTTTYPSYPFMPQKISLAKKDLEVRHQWFNWYLFGGVEYDPIHTSFEPELNLGLYIDMHGLWKLNIKASREPTLQLEYLLK